MTSIVCSINNPVVSTANENLKHTSKLLMFLLELISVKSKANNPKFQIKDHCAVNAVFKLVKIRERMF